MDFCFPSLLLPQQVQETSARRHDCIVACHCPSMSSAQFSMRIRAGNGLASRLPESRERESAGLRKTCDRNAGLLLCREYKKDLK